ncbi:ABC transporter ATP-binding protein [Streptomyces sp. bgisy100]|uniref:ABC transporter ATP-binding protein n=1 Tax=Streptomyces sp. bgisy100 TaxID=3413783 RepID=UPI003D74595E
MTRGEAVHLSAEPVTTDGAPDVAVDVSGLTVTADSGGVLLTDGTLQAPPGRVVALTGPSGCGKTTLLRAVAGSLPAGTARTAGTVRVLGRDVLDCSPARLRDLRRHHIAYLGQDTASGLNPRMRVGALLAETARDTTRPALLALLDEVRLPAVPQLLRRRPRELSGGQQRRVALARAIARRPRVLLLDEPTAGLDAALRDEIAVTLRRLAADHRLAVVLSCHDPELVGQLADEVVELAPAPARTAAPTAARTAAPAPARAAAPAPARAMAPAPARTVAPAPAQAAAPRTATASAGGSGVASSATVSSSATLSSSAAPSPEASSSAASSAESMPVTPSKSSTRSTEVAPAADRTDPVTADRTDPEGTATTGPGATAGPGGAVGPAAGPGAPAGPEPDHRGLSARGLTAHLGSRRTPVLHGVDLAVPPGASVGVVGASGAGKTTLLRTLVGLQRASGGSVLLDGAELPAGVRARSREQRRRIQLVPQDPMGALNPAVTVSSALARPLRLHRRCERRAVPGRVAELLERVGLGPEHAGRLPHELSGGQRQRVSIARALAAEPDVLVCDEVTSALDRETADAVMDLLVGLRAQGLALVLVSHDLRLVAERTGTVLVLHDGRVIESGPTARVLEDSGTRTAAGG